MTMMKNNLLSLIPSLLASIASIIPETVLKALIACGTPGALIGVVGNADTRRKLGFQQSAWRGEDDPNNQTDVDTDPLSDNLDPIRVISTSHGPEQSEVENAPRSSGSLQGRHRLNVYLTSKQRLSEILAQYRTESVLHASDDLKEGSAWVQLDKKTTHFLYKRQATRQTLSSEYIPRSGDEAEISRGTGNDEVRHGNVDGATRSRPKRKAKSLGEVLSAKRKQKPRGQPFTKRNTVEPQEQEYREEVEVVEGELELDEEPGEEDEKAGHQLRFRRSSNYKFTAIQISRCVL
ncbi:hypothetical protein K435DRAFT_803763 [Dendrothele bispora CBS 962.96]|uniref:Uncharacterized protein n=1 Tax=Dendrothele bispora (strain CBS 962.96) TaxID=1314807 RepID=A0A4S8LGY3_DENBC|nr:hypothetical protein K435DRAFT_803763 [Dendrothele bispora CBS 962.96]